MNGLCKMFAISELKTAKEGFSPHLVYIRQKH